MAVDVRVPPLSCVMACTAATTATALFPVANVVMLATLDEKVVTATRVVVGDTWRGWISCCTN